MERKVRCCRRGADPPKNELGMMVGVSYDQSRSVENDTRIGAKTQSNSQP